MTNESQDKRLENRDRACMIEYGVKTVCVDPSLTMLHTLGKKYTMLILGVIGNKELKKNFNEILADIPFSSSTIIARRLKELQISGLIVKSNEDDTVSYKLTEFGNNVREALFPLLKLMESRSTKELNQKWSHVEEVLRLFFLVSICTHWVV
ncbi:transcriptional regulator, HxlR family [mine drainage metagenome]|uniref:Transcriptional regulator, HxlR family n=1 Tax=mine drainage metagenome TaxID=410659 RepID=T1CI76_9ZZZZ